jgi:hypothetical protein
MPENLAEIPLDDETKAVIRGICIWLTAHVEDKNAWVDTSYGESFLECGLEGREQKIRDL